MKNKKYIFLLCAVILCSCSKTTSSLNSETEKNYQSAVTDEIKEKIDTTEESRMEEKTSEEIISESSTENTVSDEYYNVYKEKFSEYIYDREEWLKNGEIDYPFDVTDDEGLGWDEVNARYYMPDDLVCEVSSEDLLRLMMNWPLLSPGLYENPMEQIYAIRSMLNFADEFCVRKDRAEALYNVYLATDYISISDESCEPSEAYAFADRLSLVELLLVYNDTENMLDESEHKKLMEKLNMNRKALSKGLIYTTREGQLVYDWAISVRDIYGY